jgi:hypothetical protein
MLTLHVLLLYGITFTFAIKIHRYLITKVQIVGIATRYELDDPGIESRWVREIFRTRPDWPWVAHPASCTMGNGSLQGLKWPGRGADHPPPSKRRGHERV